MDGCVRTSVVYVRLRAYAGRGYACDDETRRVGAGRDRLVVQARLGVGSGVVVEGFFFKFIVMYMYMC